MLHAAEPRTLRAPTRATTLELTDITADASRLAGFDGHGPVWLGRDDGRGLTAIVAFHDTSPGPRPRRHAGLAA